MTTRERALQLALETFGERDKWDLFGVSDAELTAFYRRAVVDGLEMAKQACRDQQVSTESTAEGDIAYNYTPAQAVADTSCTFTGGGEPCEKCPRQITALHMCGLLQDTMDSEQKPEGQNVGSNSLLGSEWWVTTQWPLTTQCDNGLSVENFHGRKVRVISVNKDGLLWLEDCNRPERRIRARQERNDGTGKDNTHLDLRRLRTHGSVER